MGSDETLIIATMGHRFPDAVIEAEALAGTGIEVLCLGHLSKSEALEGAKGAEAVLLGASLALEADDLAMLHDCLAVVRYGVGVDNVDLAAARARGIVVSNVPDYATNEVADHTLALLLGLARGLDIWASAVREGQWGTALPKVTMRRLSNTTLGVIGAGRIGEAVIVRARPFWPRILVHDPYIPLQDLAALDVFPVSLEEVLSESDFVTVHVPSTPDTQRLLSATRLRMMKRGAILVNCSRGNVIDEEALAACLADGHLARAGLDVFAHEPPDPVGLVMDPRVWPTPHVAWLSAEALHELRRRAAQEAGRILRGEQPRHALNLQVKRVDDL